MAAAVVRDIEPLETIAEVRNYQNARLIADAPELLDSLRELYCAFGSDADPIVSEWWETQADRMREHGWSQNEVRREAQARAREVLASHPS